jgi:lipoprotein-releasing system permease protein
MNRFLPFEWIAAIRFLREGQAQTALIIVGVAVGVGVIVFMSALMMGLQNNLSNRVLSTQAQIVILPPKEVARRLRADDRAIEVSAVQTPPQRLRAIDQWQKVRDELLIHPDVVVVAPMASGSAFALRGAASKAVSLTGIEPESHFRIVDVPQKLVAGSTRLTTQDILIGTELASDLGVGVGEKMRITAASGSSQTLTIAGIFDLGNKSANQRVTYVTLRTAQSLLGLVGGVSSIDVNLRDLYAAETIAQSFRSSYGLEVDSWIKTNEQFFNAIRTQTMANLAIRFFVGLSVALGIASVLVVSVVQRSKEIGILRAMGASRAQILRVFLTQGAVVGLAGSLVGSALGAGFVLLWRLLARNPDGTPFFHVPLQPGLFAIAAVLATLTGILAALVPALRAARLDPVVAIRG